ncbi:hypothetical protein [Myroides sp. TSA_177.3]|uniref:hypothetical protein n=1 Tax=Myroides sp. TSA_177.3 TaxID=3415650 RepID=UPI004045AEBE
MKKKKQQQIKYALLGFSLLQSVIFYAQFPYFTSGQNEADFQLISESKPGIVRFYQYGVKLTQDRNEFSGVYLKNLSFTTQKGFILEFEYAFDIGNTENGKYGDGLAMILFDASEPTPKTGDRGGALGYAYTKTGANVNEPGFTKGIFGLGLDLFGNYKKINQGRNEIRNGITTNGDGNFIVLRGPYSPPHASEGYPVLFAVGTQKNSNLYLDTNTGEVISKQKGFKGKRFNLRSSALNAKPGEAGYRKIRIAFVPGIDDFSQQQGFFVFVDNVSGINSSSVIRDYFIPISGNIKYQEQVIQNAVGVPEIRDLAINIPTSMKMGFTASTGGASTRSHVRNITVSLPFSPVVQDITIPDVIRSREFVCNPLYSAVGYDTNSYSILNPPSPSTMFLDFTSFRFKVFNETTKTYEVNSDPFNLAVRNVGDFTYDKDTGAVTFTPVQGYKGASHTFYYDIKNKKPTTGVNIGAEEYRSTTASVTLNFTDEIPLYQNPPLLVNKGVKKVK